MYPNDIPLTIAEISVALAGSCAVVVGLCQTRVAPQGSLLLLTLLWLLLVAFTRFTSFLVLSWPTSN